MQGAGAAGATPNKAMGSLLRMTQRSGSVCARHRALLAPVVRGAENIPDGLAEPRGILFVGNHTRFGLYDLPFLMMELHLRGHNVRLCRVPRPLHPLLHPDSRASTDPMWHITAHSWTRAVHAQALHAGVSLEGVD